MRLAAAAIATALAWPGCSSTEPVRPLQIEVGKDFSLAAGASAHSPEAAMEIGFEAVTADSRCAKGERCVWAGDATVRIWWQPGAGPRQTRELRVAPGAGQTLRVQDHALRVLRLEPYPVTGRRIAAADYVVTLTLDPAAAGADPTR